MNQQKNTAFQMIADIEGDYNDLMLGDTPEVVPVLPVRNLVLFPSVVSPILIGRESSKLLIQRAEKKHLTIGVVTQYYRGTVLLLYRKFRESYNALRPRNHCEV